VLGALALFFETLAPPFQRGAVQRPLLPLGTQRVQILALHLNQLSLLGHLVLRNRYR